MPGRVAVVALSPRWRCLDPACSAVISARGRGIFLLGILGVALAQDLQRTNGLKNFLAGLVYGVAGVYFVSTVHVEWAPSAVIAVTSMLGASLGARYGQRLKPSTSVRSSSSSASLQSSPSSTADAPRYLATSCLSAFAPGRGELIGHHRVGQPRVGGGRGPLRRRSQGTGRRTS